MSETATGTRPGKPLEKTIDVSIWRGQGDEGRYETFRVPMRESQTVLDIVTHVQRHLDPTLS